ncbi:MAG: RNA polymerase factor sigma-54 [Bacteroidales bacterium]|nr:RNA polymerase factor sigma-54 [Bacteroidales bacterium]
MAQGLSLEQKLLQRLSPLQVQTIKILQLPQQELEAMVKKELEENPVLEDTPPVRSEEDIDTSGESSPEEAPKDISIEEYKAEEDSTPFYKLFVNNRGRDEDPKRDTLSVKESITESLMEQLGYSQLDDRQYRIAAFIVGSLTEDGYLRRTVSNVVDDLGLRFGIETDEDEVESMLHIIQGFEPEGVGARDLRECLLLQLRRRPQTEEVRLAILILDKYFHEFANRHYEKILSRAGITPEQLKDARSVILKLNPHPGGIIDDSYSDKAQQIIPDFYLTYKDGKFDIDLPRFKIPEPRLRREYAAMLRAGATTRAEKEALEFVKQKYDSANLLIEALKQRQNTLLKTMQAIIDYQHDYFIDGDTRHLRPMVLKDIADVTGFDISTISRVANSKYIETPFGVFSLKYFFSEGMENKEGEEISTKEIKDALRQCVENEDKHNPLTDDELVEKLSALGYKVARRTVAKYRDQLSIPTARLRKEI